MAEIAFKDLATFPDRKIDGLKMLQVGYGKQGTCISSEFFDYARALDMVSRIRTIACDEGRIDFSADDFVGNAIREGDRYEFRFVSGKMDVLESVGRTMVSCCNMISDIQPDCRLIVDDKPKPRGAAPKC